MALCVVVKANLDRGAGTDDPHANKAEEVESAEANAGREIAEREQHDERGVPADPEQPFGMPVSNFKQRGNWPKKHKAGRKAQSTGPEGICEAVGVRQGEPLGAAHCDGQSGWAKEENRYRAKCFHSISDT